MCIRNFLKRRRDYRDRHSSGLEDRAYANLFQLRSSRHTESARSANGYPRVEVKPAAFASFLLCTYLWLLEDAPWLLSRCADDKVAEKISAACDSWTAVKCRFRYGTLHHTPSAVSYSRDKDCLSMGAVSVAFFAISVSCNTASVFCPAVDRNHNSRELMASWHLPGCTVDNELAEKIGVVRACKVSVRIPTLQIKRADI